MKKQVLTYAISIIIPLAVGMISAALSRNNMAVFAEINKPPLAPPGWLFPVAWTILYILMGIACARIFLSGDPSSRTILIVYGLQLFFNFFWCIFFFNMGKYWFSATWLLVMWILILVFILMSRKVDMIACACFVPYIVWSTFAMYLNVGVALLN